MYTVHLKTLWPYTALCYTFGYTWEKIKRKKIRCRVRDIYIYSFWMSWRRIRSKVCMTLRRKCMSCILVRLESTSSCLCAFLGDPAVSSTNALPVDRSHSKTTWSRVVSESKQKDEGEKDAILVGKNLIWFECMYDSFIHVSSEFPFILISLIVKQEADFKDGMKQTSRRSSTGQGEVYLYNTEVV